MKQKLVTIIEDDVWLARQYKRTLARHDIATNHALSAMVAIDIIDDTKPDAIVLDVMLAGSNAIGLLHELASHDDLSKIPIVLVTNLADQLDERSIAPYNVRRMLDKSTMEPEDITAAIKAVMS